MAPSQLNWGQALSAGPEMPRSRFEWGLHTGEPTLGEEGYLGLDVVRGARIASAAHGGQVLVSETTRALLPADLPGGAEIIDLGQHSLKDLERAEHLFQVVAPGLRSDFPPPRADPAGGHKEDLERRIDEFVNRGPLVRVREVRPRENGVGTLAVEAA